ncbi:MAG: hypothetical protein ND895_01925 [Pyrinomonadaceae bacterium]|nr:hypothetical protein [Pyrinomonadaceae bacterium]
MVTSSVVVGQQVTGQLVDVDFSVNCGDNIVRLTRDDIRLLKGNIAQKPKSFYQPSELPLHLFLLIVTGTQQPKADELVRTGAVSLISSVIRPEVDKAVIATYGGAIQIQQPPTGELNKLRSAIAGIDFGKSAAGNSPLWDSIGGTYKPLFARSDSNARRVVVLLGSVLDTSDEQKLRETSIDARQWNVAIYLVNVVDESMYYGAGDSILLSRMIGSMRSRWNRLAKQTSGQGYWPRDSSEVEVAINKLAQDLQRHYRLTYLTASNGANKRLDSLELRAVDPKMRRCKFTINNQRISENSVQP